MLVLLGTLLIKGLTTGDVKDGGKWSLNFREPKGAWTLALGVKVRMPWSRDCPLALSSSDEDEEEQNGELGSVDEKAVKRGEPSPLVCNRPSWDHRADTL